MAAQDHAACAQLMGTSEPWRTLGVDAQRARALLMEQAIPGVVAQDPNGRIAGFVRYEPRGFINYFAYIRTVAVDGSQRGQGLGQALVAHVETQMAGHSPLLFLFCSSFNAGGQRFYERMGYQRVGEVPAMVVPAHGEVLYVKRLGGA